MHSIMRRVAVVNATLVVVTALAGSAFAAPPSEPPGQEKKSDQATAPAPQAAVQGSNASSTAVTASASAKGQAKKAGNAAVTANATSSSSGINATTAGVKPHSGTTKHTSCRTGGSMPAPSCTATTAGSVSVSATSDHSKRYGNATTAAQIAVSRGGTGAEVRGPGNSQPHKVCKNGHWVDVHAVKSYVGLTACATTQTTKTTGVQSTQTSGTLAATSVATTSSPAVQGAAASAAGGVGGTAANAPGHEAGGVAGAFAEVGGVAGGTLPFTGFPLWAIVLIAIAAIAIGLSLWRRGRPASTRDVV